MVAGAAELLRFARLSRERLHDPMAGKRLRADVRDALERLVASPRRPAHALAEANERIHDERRAGQADNRQPRIDVEHQKHETDEREGFARQIADRFGHDLLHLTNVVVDARHQLAGRSLREKPGRLAEDVTVEIVAEIHHHALSDVRRQVGRDVGPDALQQVDEDDA